MWPLFLGFRPFNLLMKPKSQKGTQTFMNVVIWRRKNISSRTYMLLYLYKITWFFEGESDAIFFLWLHHHSVWYYQNILNWNVLILSTMGRCQKIEYYLQFWKKKFIPTYLSSKKNFIFSPKVERSLSFKRELVSVSANLDFKVSISDWSSTIRCSYSSSINSNCCLSRWRSCSKNWNERKWKNKLNFKRYFHLLHSILWFMIRTFKMRLRQKSYSPIIK